MRCAAGIVVATALLFAARAARAADQPDGNRLVSVSMLADTVAVEPSRPFRLAVRFKIDRGWHIYWLNPGDSGVPTTVDWKLPPGFHAGPIEWPAPHAFDVPGGMVNYGYENEVLLFATITPPATINSKSLHFAADVSWLVCTQEQCLPGGGEATMTLAVGVSQPSDASASIDRWAKTVPVPAEKSQDVSSVKNEPAGAGEAGLSITWAQRVTDPKWFPLPDEQVTLGPAKISGDSRRTEIRVPVKGKSPTHGSNSVLAYTNAEGERRGLLLDFPRASGE